MTRRGVVIGALIGALAGVVLPATAQEPSVSPPADVQPVGLFSSGFMRVGTESLGECGQDSFHTPYGNGVGFLEPGKRLHWQLSAYFTMFPHAFPPGGPRVALCGPAVVPLAQAPELGTAGVCDSVQVEDGQGALLLPPAWRFGPREARHFAVADVTSSPTGSVVAVTGIILGEQGQHPGRLAMLLQRRTMGMCVHKNHEASRVGDTYTQGGTTADLTGVLAYVLPRAAVANTACEDTWGQVRRHLRGAGAGLDCPVPPEI